MVQMLQPSKKICQISYTDVRHKEHLMFNHRCRRYEIIPSFLRIKPLVRNTLGMKVAEHSSSQFLAALIGRCHAVIDGVRRMMNSLMDNGELLFRHNFLTLQLVMLPLPRHCTKNTEMFSYSFQARIVYYIICVHHMCMLH